MAINGGMTSPPRISFSRASSRRDFRSNSSGSDFSFACDFRRGAISDEESSSAEELFSAWKNLPAEITKNSPKFLSKTVQALSKSPLTVHQALIRSTSKKFEKQNSKRMQSEEKQNSKSFWGFKRSSSCGSGYSHGFCPLPLLSRSNSTGSSSPPQVHRTPLKQNAQKTSSISYQKPPLKKNQGFYGNGVQVNPILNVGFGSMLKNKSKKK